jgi:Ca2+-transporting ATPase
VIATDELERKNVKKVSFDNLLGLTSRQDGLTELEVASQTSKYGANDIVEVAGNPLFDLLKDTFKDPMIWFLVGISSIFFYLGETKEAAILFVAIIPLVVMDAILHWRTRASTAGLKSQLTSSVKVIRGSKEILLDSRQLVPGDLVFVATGTFLPADGIFQNTIDLQIDESVLTGEALPVKKLSSSIDPFALSGSGDIAVNPNFLGYAGTRVLTGTGHFRITKTGIQTFYGEIVQSVAQMPHERTPLQKSISKLVQILIWVAAIICLILAAVRIYQGHGWLDAVISAATLAVAAIPEEFPVVFTFFLGVGVYRLAKKHALVRRAVSVENIGRITYICTDKTGTITSGILTLTHVDTADNFTEESVLQCCLAASNPSGDDPVDLAIQEAGVAKGLKNYPRLKVFPFTEDRKQETAMVLFEKDQIVAFMKGSPETVLAKSLMSDSARIAWTKKTAEWAKSGHKVLACARRNINKDEYGESSEPLSGYDFCGLIAFEDPPRTEVAAAVDYCQKNEIRILMITGDHPDTAVAIAKDVGLGGANPVVSSAEAERDRFTESWLRNNPQFLRSLDVVARCTPIQKLNIVNALKAYGELVAVTGDGVNDVPALKAADIGIAMGQRGTRSAKEVSSIILADDKFDTIVNAIMEGRQLFSNLKASFEYLLLIHIPLVLTAALVPLFGYPLLYLPIHIVWLELIIHPSALFAFQIPASATNARTTNHKHFFSLRDSLRIVLLGTAVTVAIGYTFLSGLGEQANTDHARAMALAMLILWSAAVVLSATRFRTWTATAVVISTAASCILMIQTTFFSTSLQLSPLHNRDWVKIVSTILLFLFFLVITKNLSANTKRCREFLRQ